MRLPHLLLLCLFAVVLAGCSTVIVDRSPETGQAEIYNSKPTHVEEGIASWYRDHRTASGERFNINALAAAHKTLPFGTKVRVIDLKTHKSIIVRINDRGPYKKGRIIDLTVGAARQLGTYERGIAKVRIEVLREIPILTKPNIKDRNPRPAASPSPTPSKPAAKPTPKPSAAKPKPTATPASKPSPKPTPEASPTPKPKPTPPNYRNRRGTH